MGRRKTAVQRRRSWGEITLAIMSGGREEGETAIVAFVVGKGRDLSGLEACPRRIVRERDKKIVISRDWTTMDNQRTSARLFGFIDINRHG